MKRAEIEHLAQNLEKIGYEILGVEPLFWSHDESPRKVLSGAYNLKIAPLRELEEARANGKT